MKLKNTLILGNALKIDGWMNEKELVWLAANAMMYDKIVEVGCWMGRSTRALADNTDGTVWAVDHWLGSSEHQILLQDKTPDYLFEMFCKNLAEHIHSGRVRPVRLPSVQAALYLEPIKFDMVFIDGSHDYESVVEDIKAWKPMVRSGGIICGHDRGYPPVTNAILDTLGNPGGETDIWVVQL